MSHAAEWHQLDIPVVCRTKHTLPLGWHVTSRTCDRECAGPRLTRVRVASMRACVRACVRSVLSMVYILHFLRL